MLRNLFNGGFRRCHAVHNDGGRNGSPLIHSDCNSKSKGSLWSWNDASSGSGDRHLCNGHRKCATSHENPTTPDAAIIQSDHVDIARQRFTFLDGASAKRPGFYLIKNDAWFSLTYGIGV